MTEQEAQALVGAAGAIDADLTAQANPQPQAVAPADPMAGAKEWILVPETLSWAITTVFPELQSYYTDERKLDLAQRIDAVAVKYGWSGLGDFPEVLLAVGTVGFCAPAYLLYKQRKAEAAEEKKPNPDTIKSDGS